MEIFIDTADVEEIRRANELGIIDGVTTNPSLVAKTGRSFQEVVEEIVQIVDGPISLETVSTDAEGMLKEAHQLAEIHPNVVIKIPMIEEGLKAVRTLTDEGIKTNVTLMFSANQALLAAKAGASYVSPFLGRLDDIGHTGMEIIHEIRTIYDNYGFPTKILAASLRHPIHVKEAAMIGADVATIPYKALMQMVKHSLTDVGLAKFLADWEKVPNKPF
ncbi:MAG: fructose-6-phosphate aldolase [Planctomycetota bacterium]|nr:MAG: fructose-6-phosphate aldolase [Planctomycetota bacterium]